MMKAGNVKLSECKCEPNLTCRFCLRSAKPYFGFMAGPLQGIGSNLADNRQEGVEC